MAPLEVVALNPENGKSKLLSGEEIRELLRLLEAYEGELDGQGEAGALERINRCVHDLRELGLDPGWFDRGHQTGRPIFLAKVGGRETQGLRLKDLLALARETGLVEPPLSRPKDRLVYVVDDDDTFREMIAFALRKEGFNADLFTNGVELAEEIGKKERLPDVILLDLMMPQRGGFEVLRELQGGPASRVPIILLTGRNVDPRMCDALRQEANVVEFMAKPVKPRALCLSLHDLLRTRPPGNQLPR